MLDTLSKFERDPKSYGYDFANIMKVVGTQLKSFDALWIVKKIFEHSRADKIEAEVWKYQPAAQYFQILGRKILFTKISTSREEDESSPLKKSNISVQWKCLVNPFEIRRQAKLLPRILNCDQRHFWSWNKALLRMFEQK